ncbi:aminotransferase-like domain-containing protein [Enhygromyxa salina]|uniref:2-aminoadipate transaminase n=1 Tax=Enhygromyxa salina TaxID=215803 RepID=A0A2S9YNZ9_9BACT|nr:PLP-dependent aminotransferase family protein [Enhygromyxa salina]PRQ06806.1 2-aminoadipate transaminase [Enhygromyxa salina]
MTLTSQAGPFVQSSAPPGVINLGLGQPSPRLLPIAALGHAAAAQLHPDNDPLVLQYGTARGYPQFRDSLAAFLTAEYVQEISPDELMVTAGTSSALTFVSETFATPGATVIAEDPTYFLAHDIFASAGLQVRGVPTDAGGLDVDALEQLLAQSDTPTPAFVYCIPAFQNPTGVSLTPARAARLVELAERHDFIIVADEPYVALRYALPDSDDHADQAGSLTRYDRGRGRVLSLGSFSKLLAPGLRLGWAHGAPALIERLMAHGAVRSGGCLNPVVANIVHHTIDSGFLAAHVEHLREVLGARCHTLSQALHERIPSAAFIAPRGGYFCWIDLGEGIDTHALLERATDLRFIPGSRCAIGRDLSQCARLSFSFYEPHELVEGVDRLAELVAAELRHA